MDKPVSKREIRTNWTLVIMAGVAGVSLSLCLGLAGFVIGRATATPETVTETITETVTETVTELLEIEVTREIIVTVESGDVSSDQMLDESETEVESVEGSGNSSAVPTSVPKNSNSGLELGSDPDFAVFDEVWQLIDSEFDGELPPDEEILYSAIEGSLESLDDEYTRFIPPDVAARVREDATGSVSGIGAWVRENEDGFVEIVAPIEGQPADLAGLLPNDLITAVDGESVEDLSFDEVILLVRGPEGTTVSLTVLREGVEEPLSFSIIRARFEVPVVESELLADTTSPIAYLRIIEFNRNAEESLLTELDALLAQNPKGIVLDLRNNPGGFLSQAVSVADIFLPEAVVLYDRSNQGRDQTYYADDGDIAETIPLVVLINAQSASASEIVAGAIRDNGRGILIGETTFGKGSVQGVYQLSDGSELRVTIARWYTPNDISISEQGVTPDILVEMPVTAQFGSPDDIQLQRAIEYLQGLE